MICTYCDGRCRQRPKRRNAKKAEAWDEIHRRSKDAHAYCQKYLMPAAWGHNVWHAILDDAIRMRAILDKLSGSS